jgi:hypothetical protein
MIVRCPDGTAVRASSISDRRVDDPERTFGLYLDAQWQPTWPAEVVDWEVGCLGGSGRTGTALACMTVLAGVPPADAVGWVRNAYRPQAVETVEQEAWVQWFADWAASVDRIAR